MIEVKFIDQAALGVDAIIRNDRGEVMTSLSAKDLLVSRWQVVRKRKILACRWAVVFAIECGFSELVIKGDNNIITSSIRSKKCLLSRLWHIFQDAICLLNDLR